MKERIRQKIEAEELEAKRKEQEKLNRSRERGADGA